MGAVVSGKDSRLFVRCKRAQKDQIERAAAARGMSTSDYILSTALDRSSEDIQTHVRIKISQVAMDQLQELLQADIEPSAEFVRNVREYKEAIAQGTLTIED